MGLSNWYGRLGGGAQRRFLSRPVAWVAIGMVIVMMLAGFTACGGGGSSSSSGNGVVNLTYALWDQNEEVGYKQSVAQFMQQHPNIHVTIPSSRRPGGSTGRS